MSNLDKSFAQLVKYNNGMFKSSKQEEFLSSQLDGDAYYATPGSVYNNSFVLVYHCDDYGVTYVEKITKKATTVTWERDTTDDWKKKNIRRERLKELSDWINHALQTKNNMDDIIMSTVFKSPKDDVLRSMANRRENLELLIDSAFKEYDDMLINND